MGKTSIKNLNEGDIGMANYEKQVEQEAAYPIPISLYNCYRSRMLDTCFSPTEIQGQSYQ